jgi:hypothetical protein
LKYAPDIVKQSPENQNDVKMKMKRKLENNTTFENQKFIMVLKSSLWDVGRYHGWPTIGRRAMGDLDTL